MRRRHPLSYLLFSVCCAALMLLCVLSLHALYFDDQPLPRDDTDFPVGIKGPLTTRLLIICSDSVRSEPMRDPSVAPYFHELSSQGIHGTLTVPGPSLTGVSVTCFGTGRTPPISTAMSNFVIERWEHEDVFSLARRNGMRVGFFGDNTWWKMYGRTEDWNFTYPFTDFRGDYSDGWHPSDLTTLESMRRVISNEPWNILVVHFSTTDRIAHRHGASLTGADGRSPSLYQRAISNIDQVSRELHQLAGPNTTVMLLSDHGCTVSGTHGSFDPETLETRFAMAGPGILPSHETLDLDAEELAPIWSRLLGCRSPRVAERVLAPRFLNLTSAEENDTIRTNLHVRETYMEKIAGEANLEWPPTPTLEFSDPPGQRKALEQELALKLRERSRNRVILITLALVTALILLGTAWIRRSESSSFSWSLTVACMTGAWGGVILIEIWRDWVYPLMKTADFLHSVNPAVNALAGFLAGALLSRINLVRAAWVRACLSFLPLLFATLAIFTIMGWAYGPRPATFLLLASLALGALAGTGKRSAALCLLFAAMTMALIHMLANRWIPGTADYLFRVPESTGQAALAAAGFTILAVSVFQSLRKQKVDPRGPAVLILCVCIFLASWWGHAHSDTLLARAAFAAFIVGLLIVRKSRLPAQQRCFLFALLLCALYRLLVVDANYVLFIPFVLMCRLLGFGMKNRGISAGGMATMLLVLTSIWFAWGYRYKFSAFDMNTAFILVDGRLSIPAATICILMQQLIPVAVALALMGHPGTAQETGKKTTAVSGFLLSSQCITTLAVIPFFLEEGWTFLRAVHVIWFQALLFCLLCASTLLLGFSCTERKSR